MSSIKIEKAPEKPQDTVKLNTDVRVETKQNIAIIQEKTGQTQGQVVDDSIHLLITEGEKASARNDIIDRFAVQSVNQLDVVRQFCKMEYDIDLPNYSDMCKKVEDNNEL